MGSLHGKVAIVTGAADGMGKAITELFVNSGISVIANDLNAEMLEQVHGNTDAVKTVAVDVTSETAAETLVQAAMSNFDGLDILVNNAGIVDYEPVESMSDANWDSTLGVNLTATFRLCRTAIPELKKSSAGRIVNIASINAVVSAPGLGAYASAKSGITGLTKTLAVELGPDNITANWIQPGAILTGMTRPLMEDPETKALFESFSVLPRFGMPEDIAKAIRFLVSDDASFVTGTGITVDGGFLAKVS
ncbi:MAG: SDR family NAD(P)-dependent oxidoreductase [Pseudomonadota bacterium]